MRILLNLSNFTKVEDKNFFKNVATKPSQAKRFQVERPRAKKLKEKEETVRQIIC